MYEIIKGASFGASHMAKPKQVSAAKLAKRSEFERGYVHGLDMAIAHSPEVCARWIDRHASSRNLFDRGAVAAMRGEPIPWL